MDVVEHACGKMRFFDVQVWCCECIVHFNVNSISWHLGSRWFCALRMPWTAAPTHRLTEAQHSEAEAPNRCTASAEVASLCNLQRQEVRWQFLCSVRRPPRHPRPTPPAPNSSAPYRSTAYRLTEVQGPRPTPLAPNSPAPYRSTAYRLTEAQGGSASVPRVPVPRLDLLHHRRLWRATLGVTARNPGISYERKPVS